MASIGKKKTPAPKSTDELTEMFDNNEDISQYVSSDVRRVNVDFPGWMLLALDGEAKRLHVPRQAIIKELIDAGLRLRRIEAQPTQSTSKPEKKKA